MFGEQFELSSAIVFSNYNLYSKFVEMNLLNSHSSFWLYVCYVTATLKTRISDVHIPFRNGFQISSAYVNVKKCCQGLCLEISREIYVKINILYSDVYTHC